MSFWWFYSFLYFGKRKNCLLKVGELYYELSANDVDIFRIIFPEVFCKIDALKHFAKFTGNHMYWNLFFNKIANLAYNFIKKETLLQHVVKFLKTTIL